MLILERHWQIGGFTHTFRRKRKFIWDVGLHYIGAVGEGEQLRRVYDKITDGKLKWNKMPDPFDVYDYPDFSFRQSSGREAYKKEVMRLFPEEAGKINSYFEDMHKAEKWYQSNEMKKGLPLLLKWVGIFLPGDKKFSLQTTQNYMDSHFTDLKLKAVLTSQWGDYGLPPEKSPLALHAILTNHYIDGGYYPVGSAEKIAEYSVPVITRNGGEVKNNSCVDKIIIENNRATGVEVFNTRDNENPVSRYYAPVIISAAGAYITYARLLPQELHPWQKRIKDTFENSELTSHLSLYLGLKKSPESLGIKGENHWIYQGYDHNQAYRDLRQWDGKETPKILYASFPSLKDPDATAHTAELITFCDYKFFEKWKNEPWKKRGDEYE